eukprot:4101850-Alexandrium_andersonii.AAC.1
MPPARPPARFISRFGICTKQWRRTHPSAASASQFEVVSDPEQFKLRTPQAISHFLGEFQGAPGRSGELGSGPLPLLTLLEGCLLYTSDAADDM